MNIPVRALVPTQARAIERHNKFHQSIAEQAAKLAAKSGSGPSPVRIRPEATVQLPPMPCGLPSWYFIIPPAEFELTETLIPVEPRISFIIDVVSNYYLVGKKDLLSARRTRELAMPRQIACYLCKELTGKSLPQIGRDLGGRDHSTIHHAIKKITRLISQDSALANDIATLTHAITGKYQ